MKKIILSFIFMYAMSCNAIVAVKTIYAAELSGELGPFGSSIANAISSWEDTGYPAL